MNKDNPPAARLAVEPRAGGERIVALDALRGFALLGILLVNIMGFSGINALGAEAEGADRIVADSIRFFVQGKLLSLFAMLFGVGFCLQTTRLRDKGAGLFPIWWRRLAVLFVIGLLHALLDPAEVLAVYALCAVPLVIFQKLSGKAVLSAAIVLMGLPHLQTAIVTPVYVEEPAAEVAPEASSTMVDDEAPESALPEESAATEPQEEEMHAWNPYLGGLAIRVHSSGTFAEVVDYNRRFTARRWIGSWVAYSWMTVPLPLMIVGMLIWRSGVLTRLGQEKTRLKRVFWFGLGGGIVMGILVVTLYDLAAKSGWNPWIAFPANWLFSLSGLIMALAYSAGLLLLLQRRIGAGLQAALAPVGRMALTNYLLQTIICISLFYAFGLGLYGHVGASQAALIAVAIFAMQIVISRLWLRTFRFGPVEWLWRMATYWRGLALSSPRA
jgi:uncharacterized protein